MVFMKKKNFLFIIVVMLLSMIMGCGKTTAKDIEKYISVINTSITKDNYYFYIIFDDETMTRIDDNTYQFRGTISANWDSDNDGMIDYSNTVTDKYIINRYRFSDNSRGIVDVYVDDQRIVSYDIEKQNYYTAVGWYVVGHHYYNDMENPAQAYLIMCGDVDKHKLTAEEQWMTANDNWAYFDDKIGTIEFIVNVVGKDTANIISIKDKYDDGCIEIATKDHIFEFYYISEPKVLYDDNGEAYGNSVKKVLTKQYRCK